MKRYFLLFSMAALILLFASRCSTTNERFSTAANIALQWELVGNDLEGKGFFTAKFTLSNHSDFTLTNDNWALYFNQASILLESTDPSQPARVEHINGDWYKMTPTGDFELKVGETVEVIYKGNSAMIKVTDSPLGSYFVFYNKAREEVASVQVSDYTLVPFNRPEQITRGGRDVEPEATPQNAFYENSGAQKIPADKLPAVIPSPYRVLEGKGHFTVDKDTRIAFAPGLEKEAGFLINKLSANTGREFTIDASENCSKCIRLDVAPMTINNVTEEAYRLEVTNEWIRITGSDATGVFYGIQSLLAMVPLEVYQQKPESFRLPAMQVEDAPRLRFRGLHVDVSRNFQSKETIMRILDMMAFYKLNRFLFYTTEDEGWRVEIDGLPELTSVGAQRHHTSGMDASALHPAYGSGPVAYENGKHGSGFYTRNDFIEILKYAAERHITVIPELNFPGHARAAIKSMEARYERLMEEGREEEANEYRLIDPDDKSEYYSAQNFRDNVVCVARESTYRFYEKVVDEMASMYAEAGLEMKDFHAGGDEVADGAWTQSPMALELLDQHPEVGDPKNLQAYFFEELVKRLEARDLTIHGWEEVALLKQNDGSYKANPEFADRKVVPYIWNNLWDYDLGYRLANAGYHVVLCNVTNFYFDLAYNKDPLEPGLYWAGFVKTRDAWTFAPYDYFKTTLQTSMGRVIDPDREFADVERLRLDARKNILGIEAQLWSETIKGRDMIEYYMLPKLIGFAESAWTAERAWETVENRQQREDLMNDEWNVFANALGQRELPRLSYINSGYNYRLPLPGALVEEGMLMANIEFPGLDIRFTTDGSEPHATSPLYMKPTAVSGMVRLKAFDASGKGSRTIEVSERKIE